MDGKQEPDLAHTRLSGRSGRDSFRVAGGMTAGCGMAILSPACPPSLALQLMSELKSRV